MRQSGLKRTTLRQTENSYGSIQFDQNLQMRIQFQKQKLYMNEQQTDELKKQCQKLKLENEQKKIKIDNIKKTIHQIEIQETESPIMKQLREHYKVMREQIRQSILSSQQASHDEIDIDAMTYEQLLELGEKIGKISKGISEIEFKSLERIQYTSNLSHNICSICHEQFQNNCQLIRLPCLHTFDVSCLQQWLKIEKTCPICLYAIK